jgi:ribonuclease D
VQKIIQYSPFETKWMAVHLGVMPNNVFDTWAAWCVIQKRLKTMTPEQIDAVLPGWREKFPNGLASIVRQRLGFDMPKDEQAGPWMDDELSVQQIRYAALDVAVLAELAEDVQQILDALGIKPGNVEGLRRWAIGKNFEEDRLDASVHMRDQRSQLHTALLAARTPQAIDDAWDAGRRMVLTARNRQELQGIYEQRARQLRVAVHA